MTTLGPRTLYTVSLGITRPPSADPEGGTGGSRPPPPWKITSYMGYMEKVGPPWKKLDLPTHGKCWTPSGTLKNERFL